jgi:anti-anti-sigma factor
MHHDTTHTRLFSRRTRGHTVLAICGELDIATTAALRDQIAIVLKNTTTLVIIDLSGVSFCDASGLALLVGTRRRARLHGLTVVLAAPRHSMSRLLSITGLGRAFTVHPTLAAARLDHGHPAHPAVA